MAADGGDGGNRTPDTRIFSPLLYRLSYVTLKTTPEAFFGVTKVYKNGFLANVPNFNSLK
jgi:hypothetical protein